MQKEEVQIETILIILTVLVIGWFWWCDAQYEKSHFVQTEFIRQMRGLR